MLNKQLYLACANRARSSLADKGALLVKYSVVKAWHGTSVAVRSLVFNILIKIFPKKVPKALIPMGGFRKMNCYKKIV